MAGVIPWRTVGAVEFVEIEAPSHRATPHREHAAHLSVMAGAEPIGLLRTRLLEIAARYEELAENLEKSHGG